MKNIRLPLIILFMLIPISFVGAWKSSDSLKTIFAEFANYIQPEAESKYIAQGNMTAQYIPNKKNLTDKIIITIGKTTRTVKGPWSQASQSKRSNALKCMKEGSYSPQVCGFFDYNIIRLSPTGNYIELFGAGWENKIWRMVDTKTGKIVLSNDNGIIKSMWSSDRQRFIWQTDDCSIGGCSDEQGIFLTDKGNFPKYTKIQ